MHKAGQTKSQGCHYPSAIPESKSLPVALGEVSLFDILFTERYNKTPSGQVIYAEASNPEINVTYEQLKHRVLVCAAALKNEFGLQTGDVVGICSQNNIMYPILFFGTIAAGKISKLSCQGYSLGIFRLCCCSIASFKYVIIRGTCY